MPWWPVGLCLIWGLMEIVNFAHGEILMLAMFTAFLGLRPLPSGPSPLPSFLHDRPLSRSGWRPTTLSSKKSLKAPFLAQILATFGLGIFLRYSGPVHVDARFPDHQGSHPRREYPPGRDFSGIPQFVASLICIATFIILYWFINRTEVGAALLATSEDREAASLMGINSDKMFALGWGIGAACLGVAGALMSNFYYIFPEVGFSFSLIAYVAVALGGFGSIPGSFIAGIIIGLVEFLSGLFIAPAFKYAFVFLIYLLVVFIRPQGLWGRY